MKVLFVVNNFYAKGNGLSASARRTVKHLEERGLEVRVLSGKNPENDDLEPYYSLDLYKMPIFDKLVKKQGYVFAKSDKVIVKEAIEWADLIHLEEPFALEMLVARMAKKMHKPCVATYHLHPENLFASVKLDGSFVLNKATMLTFKTQVFDKCVAIQCPTQNVMDRLNRWHFKAKLYLISNGLPREELKKRKEITEKIKFSDAKYMVTTIGRHSVEKDLITLLKAMKYTKHRDEIQLVFAGRGPKTEDLKKYAQKLVDKGIIKYPPVFKFCTIDELQQLSASSDLYIHLAYIEVEGLSCMEAIQVGLVPIIAEHKYSATSQFALSEMSKFKAKDPKDLAQKIDYWLDDDERRIAESKKYKALKYDYDIESSINDLIDMYKNALLIFNEK